MKQFCNNQLQTAVHEFQTISNYNMFYIRKDPIKMNLLVANKFRKVKSNTTKIIKIKVCADSGKEIKNK